jgi:hypothetical protein
MSSPLAALRAHRAALVLRSAEQREQLAAHAAHLQRATGAFELGLTAARSVRAHPFAVGLAVAALSLRFPGRALRWLRTGVTLYSLARSLATMLRAR